MCIKTQLCIYIIVDLQIQSITRKSMQLARKSHGAIMKNADYSCIFLEQSMRSYSTTHNAAKQL